MVFAFETAFQPHGQLPLLGSCAAAYLVSGLMMRNTIATGETAGIHAKYASVKNPGFQCSAVSRFGALEFPFDLHSRFADIKLVVQQSQHPCPNIIRIVGFGLPNDMCSEHRFPRTERPGVEIMDFGNTRD